MASPPPLLRPDRLPLPEGASMVASVALGAGCRTLLAHPIAALIGLLPLLPIAALDALQGRAPQPLLAAACALMGYVLLGPALVGCWRHYLRLVDGARPSPADWVTGYRFLLPTLLANILRFAAVAMAIVPAVLLLSVYLVVTGSGLIDGGAPSASDIAAFLLLATPAAAGIVCVKCLTYPFEILFADGRASRFGQCLDGAVRLAWRNIRPIAWVFTAFGLVAIPLMALAFLVAPMLPQPPANPAVPVDHPLADSLPALHRIERALELSIIPLLPWIFLALAHAHRQVLPAAPQHPKETRA